MRQITRLLVFSILISGATAGIADVSYDDPPKAGDYLQPQPRLIHCSHARAARFSSNTGFIGEGCQALVKRDTWTVTRRSKVQLQEGGMWLVRIENELNEVRFVPVPWHDWI